MGALGLVLLLILILVLVFQVNLVVLHSAMEVNAKLVLCHSHRDIKCPITFKSKP